MLVFTCPKRFDHAADRHKPYGSRAGCLPPAERRDGGVLALKAETGYARGPRELHDRRRYVQRTLHFDKLPSRSLVGRLLPVPKVGNEPLPIHSEEESAIATCEPAQIAPISRTRDDQAGKLCVRQRGAKPLNPVVQSHAHRNHDTSPSVPSYLTETPSALEPCDPWRLVPRTGQKQRSA